MTSSSLDSPCLETSPVIITGMSGGGQSSAAKVLEDKGFYVIQNVPAQFIEPLLEVCLAQDPPLEKVAFVVGVRSRVFGSNIRESLRQLEEKGLCPTVLFMDARDDVLIKRFDTVRRTHPLQDGETLQKGIAREREMTNPVRAVADIVLDTSSLSVHDLRRAIEASFGTMAHDRQHVTLESFGFKHGAPRDADLMIDARFLPNPFWVPELRDLRGTDGPVSDYVLSREGADEFLDRFVAMFQSMLAGYRQEGKNFITVAVGCTGGHHRSVAVSEELGRRLAESGELDVNVMHRDIDRD